MQPGAHCNSHVTGTGKTLILLTAVGNLIQFTSAKCKWTQCKTSTNSLTPKILSDFLSKHRWDFPRKHTQMDLSISIYRCGDLDVL